MNTRQELLRCLPVLPSPTNVPQIATDVWMGFRQRWTGPVLARVRLGGGNRQIHEPSPGVNLCVRNIDRQMLWRFSEHYTTRDRRMLQLLNTQLGGGRQYPLVEFAVGQFGGLPYSVLSQAISSARTRRERDVRVREDDEIWVVEMVGRESPIRPELKHVHYLWLVDVPRGGRAGSPGANAWILMEERHELVAEEARTAGGYRDMVDLIPPPGSRRP
jgi:hypothetical protein